MNFQDLLKESREIYDEAMTTYKPYAVVLLLSGGDDSILTKEVANQIGIRFDMILHGVTGTGIQEATDFVKQTMSNSGILWKIADAGDAYINYVMRKGFFGCGNDAHAKAYHVLKAQPFRTAISHNIRKGIAGRYILLINGVRIDESENRADKLGDKYFNIDPAMLKNVWVNLVHWWPTKARDEYLAGNSVKRNPVSILMNRSGECLCGSMQSMATGMQAAELFPKWGKWWLSTRKEVMKKFPWDWSQNINKYHHKEMLGQGNLFKEQPFMPMCVGCKAKVSRKIS